MTSTEFTIGLEGTRVSSKVLRPPGGVSSDIFGLGTRQYAASNGTGEKQANQVSASNTQNRLFGAQDEPCTPGKTNAKSNIFAAENPKIVKSTKKTYVRRNPITGEEIIMNHENTETENNIKEDKEDTENKQENGNEDKKIEVPTRTVQTSIRIRNPPGGKSSGIF